MIFMRLANAKLDSLTNIENHWSLDDVVYAHMELDNRVELEREAHRMNQEKLDV